MTAPDSPAALLEADLSAFLATLSDEELDALAGDETGVQEAPAGWREWLAAFFPRKVSKGFAPHHVAFWEWVWSLEPGVSPNPHVGIWPRGGGKTTGMELAAGSLLAREKRRFILYVSGVQGAANVRLQGISELLTDTALARSYPDLGQRALNAHGNPVGWRQDFIRSASGAIVVPVGLDSAMARGIKVGDERPDLIIFDDVDGEEDTPEASDKKERIITRTILPAGGDGCAVAFVQNLIIPHGIAARLAGEKAAYLIHRRISGPVPAVRGLKTETVEMDNGRMRSVITEGEASWEGQDLEACQRLIDDFGLPAFLREQQHEVRDVEGALLKAAEIRHVTDVPRLNDAAGTPALVRVAIGVDPPGGRTECGIVAIGDAGPGAFPRFYVWRDRTTPAKSGPATWGDEAVLLAIETGGVVYAEGNYGGSQVDFIIKQAAADAGAAIRVERVTAKIDKAGRAQPWIASIQLGETVFVGYHHALEVELTTWVPKPGAKSPNRIDAGAHAFNALAPAPSRSSWGGYSPWAG